MHAESELPFLPSRQYKKGHAGSAFCDACHTSSGCCLCTLCLMTFDDVVYAYFYRSYLTDSSVVLSASDVSIDPVDVDEVCMRCASFPGPTFRSA
jgi:hypothetical protein